MSLYDYTDPAQEALREGLRAGWYKTANMGAKPLRRFPWRAIDHAKDPMR